MKKILLLVVAVNLFALSYETLFESKGKGYQGSMVYISGTLSSYSCYRTAKESKDHFCSARLKVKYKDEYLKTVSLKVGTTWESDFKSAYKDKTFSFMCTYEDSIYNFRDCR